MSSTSTDRRFGVNSGMAIKVPCAAATTANITLSGEQTIDGVACVTGDRVLVKNQTTGSQNGIWEVDTGAWSRAKDFDDIRDVTEGTLISVIDGTVNSDTMWRVTNTGTITPGSTALTFENAMFSDSASVAFLQSGTGAVERTVQSKLRDWVCVLDFMTDSQIADVRSGAGLVDVTAAIQAAIDYVESVGMGGVIYVPMGAYLISSTITINDSGITIKGDGADEARVTWGSWPTRFKWGGSTNDRMFEIDSGVTGVVRAGTFEGVIIDAQNTAGVAPIYANPSASHWRLKNVAFRNFDTNVYLGTSCYGWLFEDVEVFNSQGVGIRLEGLNHHTTFNRLRASGTGITAATSVVRVGESDRCSNINFTACDFEAQNTTYQVELLNARAVNVSGGYSEATSNATAIFRLGVTGLTTCEGFTMNGFYVQGNDPTYTLNYAVNVLNASGVDIGGGNHFRNIATAVVNSPAACPNSNFGSGNYLENCGGAGNKVKFNNLLSGWSFHDSGTTTPTVVGTGGTANTYTTQKCQWWVRDGHCHFDLEILLSALNQTGPLVIDTGIPYNAAGSYDYPVAIASYSGFSLAAGSMLMARVTRGTNDINLREQVITGSGDSTVLNTEASGTMGLKISGTFPISPAP